MTKHGAPDWSRYRRDAITFPIEDLAELAVRLGSIDTFDRRGDVILQESFEHGLGRWNVYAPDTLDSAAVDTTIFRSGPQSVKMIPATDGGKQIQIRTAIYYPTTCKIGVEFSVSSQDAYTYLMLLLNLYDGTKLKTIGIRYDRANTTIYLEPAGGGTKTIATNIKFSAATWCWHTIKLVVDLVDSKATRLIFDDNEYDLSAYVLSSTGSDNAPTMQIVITIEGPGAASPVVHVDDVIVTQDEP